MILKIPHIVWGICSNTRYFFLLCRIDALTQLGRRVSMIAFVKMHLDGQVPAGIFFLIPISPDNADTGREYLEKLVEVCLGIIENDVVNIANSAEQTLSLGQCLHGLVFVGTVKGRIRLESNNEVVADALTLLKNENMPVVAEIKGSAGDANNSFSLRLCYCLLNIF